MLRLQKYNPVLQTIVHFAAAFVVLTKALSLFLIGSSSPDLIAFFIVMGILLALFAVFRTKIIPRLKYSEGVINLVESLLLLYIGVLYSKEGRFLIQYALYVAAFNYFVAGVLSLIKLRSSE